MSPTADKVEADRIRPGHPASPSGSLQAQYAVLTAIREGSEPSRVYWLMNALATVIACYS